MCKLLLAINHKEGANAKFTKLVQAQYESLRNQPDGIAAYILTQDNQQFVLREFKDYDTVFNGVNELLDNAKVVSLHTRIGTGGSKNIDNVHYFNNGGYILAHNGFITKFHKSTYGGLGFSDYGTSSVFGDISPEEFEVRVADCNGCATTHDETGLCKTHKKLKGYVTKQKPLLTVEEVVNKKDDMSNFCDSKEFLYKMPKPVTIENLKKFIDETKMNGFMTVVNQETNDLFMVVKKEVLMITDNTTFDMYTSYDPELKVDKTVWKYRNGIPYLFSDSTEKLKYKPFKVSYGTFKVEY